ncbi:DNA sulfur modification protein DndD [Halomonas meridiana]|uniref:DNA sulfur modification protein DndD n=1 Tax=Vreelandella aquamarina TaxID=77097 RepID=UPI001E55CBC4|nr:MULTISPECIES: DNA sulfur modification protein DndD [Halomonas]MCD1652051.1 DNA sulfur modification protein DndD [Halomonas axialensis]MCD2088342.1 DNA sulfur modification protein DndD [Halomonas meridiana]
MILNTLQLGNFRVYSGNHEIDLRPNGLSGEKPIILFGGLNGAGKTSILTAVRLALYGRRTLGNKVGNDTYHRYLADSIHKPSGNETPHRRAYVRLKFSDSKGGYPHDYDVVRSWFVDTSGVVSEKLQITRDDEVLKSLTYEQAQSFLNDLIPIGIADLFFFDGEKIAELAESNGNAALANAIERLLGLDLVSKLRADLSVYIRNHAKGRLPDAIRKEAEQLESDYQRYYTNYQIERDAKEALEDQLHNLKADIAQQEQKIEAHGGAWYENRSAEQERMERLLAEQHSLKARIRTLKGSLYPVALAPTALGKLLEQLDKESDYRKQLITHKAAKRQANALRKELASALAGKEQQLDEAIAKAFGKNLVEPEKIELIHDLSDSEIERLRHQITVEAPRQKQEVDTLEEKLERLRHELSECATNLERAPDEQRIKPLYAKLHEAQLSQGRLHSLIEEKRENAKRELRAAMDCLRKLRKLEAEHQSQSDNAHAIEMANNVRDMLSSYIEKAKISKVKELEHAFGESFKRLSRKSYEHITPRIDPQTFAVNLEYADGRTLDRNQLSAGEKQIYATAMLEALGKCSGKRLPIIIDTPLGRLDSEHRQRIIDHYFPTASHQVVLLSTDTEIALGSNHSRHFNEAISKAYEMIYNPETGSTTLQEGYFDYAS